ncbi:hypothetical protein P4V43_09515 [Brevibacillus fortis]|nr:hypothetical protein [Brevibacillus fortis]
MHTVVMSVMTLEAKNPARIQLTAQATQAISYAYSESDNRK